jgi:hypothetical protein
VPVDSAWRLSRTVLDGRLLVVPDAGHEAFRLGAAVVTPALGEFYRATATVARARAGARDPTDAAPSTRKEDP